METACFSTAYIHEHELRCWLKLLIETPPCVEKIVRLFMCLFCFSGSSKSEWLCCFEHYRQQHSPELDTCGWRLWISSHLEAHLGSAVNHSKVSPFTTHHVNIHNNYPKECKWTPRWFQFDFQFDCKGCNSDFFFLKVFRIWAGHVIALNSILSLIINTLLL